MLDRYVLDGEVPVPCPDLMKWAAERESRTWGGCVGRTDVGGKVVHTSFLGIDHNFDGDGPPLLFETMVRDAASGEWDDFQERYATWEEAEKGHKKAVESQLHPLQLAALRVK